MTPEKRVSVALIAKTPIAGRVKTRLCPPCTPEQAALIARALLDHALATIAEVANVDPVVLLDGDPGTWIPRGWRVVSQRGRGLDERLANGFDDIGGPCIIMAMDSPEVTPSDIADAVAALGSYDTVIGPTSDGGYWCIGVTSPSAAITIGVPMSQLVTCDCQRTQIRELGLSCTEVATHDDIDTFDDALRVSARMPSVALTECIRTAAHSRRQ